MHPRLGAGALLLAATLAAPPARADFFEGKTITIVVGFSAGGIYDQMARFYARNMPRFLAGKPTIIVNNMPGAGSLIATAHIANAAPKDGTRLGIVGGGTVWEHILGNPQVTYNARAFQWIGAKSRDTVVCAIWTSTPVKSIEDVKRTEIVVGATGPGSRTVLIPRALNELAGTKFRVVSGYPGGSEIYNAMEKGEVHGYCGWAMGAIKRTAGAHYRAGRLNILAQFVPEKDKELPNSPLGTDVVSTDVGRGIMQFIASDAVLSWPMFAPPGVPADRVAELRRAFDTMLKDPAVLAEAEKENLEIDAVPGTVLDAQVAKLYETPPPVLDMIRTMTRAK